MEDGGWRVEDEAGNLALAAAGSGNWELQQRGGAARSGRQKQWQRAQRSDRVDRVPEAAPAWMLFRKVGLAPGQAGQDHWAAGRRPVAALSCLPGSKEGSG